MDEKRFNPRRCRWVRREMYGLRQREAFLCKEMEDPPKDSKNVQTWRHIITTGIKKESPNEGTETSRDNKLTALFNQFENKKRIPE